jgi:hypothetical protein
MVSRLAPIILHGGLALHGIIGVAVAIWGTTAKAPQEFSVSIDGNPSYETSTSDKDPQSYLQWYQSPQLPPGQHSINVTNILATGIDYFVVTPGPDTSLEGKSLLVDDMYPGIKYNGAGWKARRGQRFRRREKILAQPFQNGTHQTTNIGDSLFFAFQGDSLSSCA